MAWFDFFKAQKDVVASPKVEPEVHRRSDVVKEFGRRPPPPLEVMPHVAPRGGIHERRKRDIINESLGIAMKTKRRDTAESRLQVAEDLLNELVSLRMENADDRINRHTLGRLREGLDRRFPIKSKK